MPSNTLHTVTKIQTIILLNIRLIISFIKIASSIHRENSCMQLLITRMIHKHWPAGFYKPTAWGMNDRKNHQEQYKQLKVLMHGHIYDKLES